MLTVPTTVNQNVNMRSWLSDIKQFALTTSADPTSQITFSSYTLRDMSGKLIYP